jgi:hypothetical protein
MDCLLVIRLSAATTYGPINRSEASLWLRIRRAVIIDHVEHPGIEPNGDGAERDGTLAAIQSACETLFIEAGFPN